MYYVGLELWVKYVCIYIAGTLNCTRTNSSDYWTNDKSYVGDMERKVWRPDGINMHEGSCVYHFHRFHCDDDDDGVVSHTKKGPVTGIIEFRF